MIDPAWGPVTEDRLTRDLTIVQRARGHRFSSDDMATAYVACRRVRSLPEALSPGTPPSGHAPPGPPPRDTPALRVLDLGCGIGSVLLHLAWSLPTATLVGIEAQDLSFALLTENVRRNQLGARVTIHHGDLRALRVGQFDLVTGTPPYFPPDTAVDAQDPQRAYARIEYRGGIDAYVLAGAEALAPGGSLVLCGDARTEDRLRAAADQVGLHVVARTSIVAHAPKPPLFAVWTLAHAAEPLVTDELVLRDAAGNTTPDAARLRAFSGF